MAAALLVVSFVLVAGGVVLALDHQQRGRPNGDEPHYLVVARSLLVQHRAEVEPGYREEMLAHRYLDPSITAPHDAPFATVESHAIRGPSGWYSVHGLGVPALIAAPARWGGVLGARLTLVALAGLLPLGAWLAAAPLVDGRLRRAVCVLATTVGLPFVLGAGQIYPDLVAGALVLFALAACIRLALTPTNRIGPVLAAVAAGGMAFLPWLHARFLVVAVFLATALAMFQRRRRSPAWWAVPLPLIVSLAGLALYNYRAFGDALGPYTGDVLVPGKAALVVLLGLHVDRAQGMFVQQPLLLLGVAGLVPLARRHVGLTGLVVGTYGLLVVPVALHPNLYGGASYVGRFQWTSAATLLVPTLTALNEVGRRARRVLPALLVTGAAYQAWALWLALGAGMALTNPGLVLLAAYPSWWGPLGSALPALYNPSWALRLPLSWIGLSVVAVVIALLAWWLWAPRPSGRLGLALLCVAGAGAVMGTVAATATAGEQRPWDVTSAGPNRLIGSTGQVAENMRVARSPYDAQGVVAISPWTIYAGGSYEAVIAIISTASPGTPVGSADVIADHPLGREARCVVPIEGTGGLPRAVHLRWSMPSRLGGSPVHVRAFFTGGDLAVARIDLRAIPRQATEQPSCGEVADR